MPKRAGRACLDCGQIADAARCPDCARKIDRQWHDPKTTRFYSQSAWRRTRQQVLMDNPWCTVAGCTNPATDVDHKTPRNEGGADYDRKNLQGLCRKHHSEKTAREVWGRKA